MERPLQRFRQLARFRVLYPANRLFHYFRLSHDVAEWGGKVPTSIKDVFDLKKFPGKRSLEKRPINNLEWALLADGVSADKVYDVLSTKEGVDRAFAKLDTIKMKLSVVVGGGYAATLGRRTNCHRSTYNGRLFALIEEDKQPVAMLWDWQVFDLDGWIIPKNLSDDRKKAALEYIYFATDTQRLADQASISPMVRRVRHPHHWWATTPTWALT